MNFESLWPILSVWGDKQYFFREIKTAVLTADDVLNQFLSFFIWFIQIIVFITSIIVLSLLLRSLLNHCLIQFRLTESGPKWTVLKVDGQSKSERS